MDRYRRGHTPHWYVHNSHPRNRGRARATPHPLTKILPTALRQVRGESLAVQALAEELFKVLGEAYAVEAKRLEAADAALSA